VGGEGEELINELAKKGGGGGKGARGRKQTEQSGRTLCQPCPEIPGHRHDSSPQVDASLLGQSLGLPPLHLGQDIEDWWHLAVPVALLTVHSPVHSCGSILLS
jgi:hypothetical protein